MSTHTKDLREIAFTKETVRGTAVAVASGDWVPVLEFDVKEEVMKKENVSRVGTLAAYEGDRLLSKRYTGTMKYILERKIIGKLLMGILGTVNTSANAPESGVNTHTFTRSDSNQLPSYTVSTQDPSESDQTYSRGTMKSLKIAYATDDYLIADVEFDATTKAAGSFTSSYFASNNYELPWMCSLKLATTVAGLGAATAITLQNINLDINRLTNFVPQLGNTEAADIVSGRLEVKGELMITLDDTTYKALAQTDNTYRAMDIIVTDTSTTIGAVTNPSIRIRLPKVSLRNFDRDIKDEFVSQKIEFIAIRDNTDGDVSVQLINDVTSY